MPIEPSSCSREFLHIGGILHRKMLLFTARARVFKGNVGQPHQTNRFEIGIISTPPSIPLLSTPFSGEGRLARPRLPQPKAPR